MSTLSRRDRAMAAMAIALSGAAAATAAAGPVVLAATLAGGATFVLGIDLLVRRATRPAAGQRQIEKFVSHGRKLVIYERDTGLFAHWYVELRGNEECDRARRYGRSLTLLVIEPVRTNDAWDAQERLAAFVTGELRQSDIVGYLGNGRYVLLMPESTPEGAQHVIDRLKDGGLATDVGIGTFPEDGATFDQLYKCAAGQLPISLRHVA